MPKFKRWTAAEKIAAAKAYKAVSVDPVKGGADKGKEAYALRIYETFVQLGPPNPEPGTYKDRKPASIVGYLRDRIRKPLMKFKNALRKVTDCDPPGCDEHSIMNMAYAIFDGKTDRMQGKFRTYNATINWDLYGSWMILRDLPMFQNDPRNVDLLAKAGKRQAREEAPEKQHTRNNDEPFDKIQSSTESIMERSLNMISQQLKRQNDLMALKLAWEMEDDEETRAGIKRKLFEISGI
jgi:hypothetical protein